MADRPGGGLRLLAVTPSYAPCIGGAETLLRQVSERLVARGHAVTILTANGSNQKEIASAAGGGLPSRELINGVSVCRFRPDHPVATAFRRLTRMRGGWRLATALTGDGITMCRRLPSPVSVVAPLLRSSADVVLSVNWIWPPAYGVHLGRRLRRFRLVGVPIFHIARRWADHPVYRRMLAECDAVLTLTEAETRFVRERCDRPALAVGAGVDPDAFANREGASLRQRHGLTQNPVIGFLGRQDGLKGVVTLIAAMRIVWASRPDAILLLAGQRAHRSEDVSAALVGLSPGERKRVLDLPDVPEGGVPSILDACDVVALPSVEESFGLVFLEAWMCRKPVVGARIPSTECVIEEGRDGLLARPMDPEDLARCLLELVADPARRHAMGEQGYRKTLAHYTWAAVTDRWESALEGVARPNR